LKGRLVVAGHFGKHGHSCKNREQENNGDEYN
jgi:hypothetical protein